MAVALFENLGDAQRQAVADTLEILKEKATPTWSAIKKSARTKSINEKGFRIPKVSKMPGGHTAFTASSTSFNAAISPQTTSMYVYPVRYALPMQFDGGMLRAFSGSNPDSIISLGQIYEMYVTAAAKRINQMCYGDGSGLLAVLSSNPDNATAGQTISCDTVAESGYGHTKGSAWLEAGHVYQSYTSAGSSNGTITVATEGKSSFVGDTSANPAADDIVTDVGAWNKYFRGFAHLNSNTSRVLQGLDTSVYTDLNAYEVDLNGSLVTVASIEKAKTGLVVRNGGEKGAANGLVCFTTPGQLSLLRTQGYNLSQYIRNTDDGDVVKGVARKYVDGDTVFIEDPDCDEDRFYFFDMSAIAKFEEMPFGEYDLDGQKLRMYLGTNTTGSDTYQRAIGWVGNLGVTGLPRTMAYIKRAQISTAVTQVNT